METIFKALTITYIIMWVLISLYLCIDIKWDRRAWLGIIGYFAFVIVNIALLIAGHLV
jgi:hypothetical protein